MRIIAIAGSVLLVVGCVSSPSKVENSEKERIAAISGLPLQKFLSKYYLNQERGTEGVEVTARFSSVNSAGLMRARNVLAEYCANNGGALVRLPESQLGMAWDSVSPEAFQDPKRETMAYGEYSAAARNDLPTLGAIKASREGAFGIFNCIENKSSQNLWKIRVRGGAGMNQSQYKVGATEAVMPIKISVD